MLIAVSVAAQPTSEDYKASYERQKAAVGPAGLGVKGILNDWSKAYPEDTDMLKAVFTYNLAKGRGTTLEANSARKYLGKEPLFPLKDSTGTTVYYYEVPVYDDTYFAEAQKAIEKAIFLAPTDIGYRFDRISSLLDYEGGSPDMTTAALLDLIDYNSGPHPAWTVDGQELAGQDFVDAMKEYCLLLWNLSTPDAYESFHAVSEKLHYSFPKDPGFLDNLGAYEQVVNKNNKKAAKYYKKALKLDPDDFAAKRNLQIIDKTKIK